MMPTNLSTHLTENSNTPHVLERFSTEDLRQLCFIAYFGNESTSGVGTYMKMFGLPDRDFYNDNALKLQQEGLLVTRNMVSPEWHLDLIDYLATKHPEWVEQFRRIQSCTPSHSCDYLWRLAKALRNDDFEGAKRISKPYEGIGRKLFNIFPYIRHRAIADPRYAHLLDNEQLHSMVTETMEHLFTADTLDEDTLASIEKMIPTYHPAYSEIRDRISLYRYFISGKTNGEGHQTTWSMAQHAIDALYHGDVEDAFALFRKALKKQGRNAGAFPRPLLNYCYVISLLRFRTKYGPLSVTKETDALRQASSFRTDHAHFAAKLLLDYSDSDASSAREEIRRRIAGARASADTPQKRYFAFLMSRYFDLPDDDTPYQQPSAAILMHECSLYKAASMSCREELVSLFGGTPLLSTIRKKQPWEILLGEIDNVAKTQVDNRRRRIVYFLNRQTLSGIVEQVEDEPGTWRDEKLLSKKIMADEGYDSMDAADTRIAVGLAGKADWQTDADIIVPLLADTDRLYIGVEYLPTRQMATINVEKPYVEFHGEADKIVIRTNALRQPDGSLRKHSVTFAESAYTLVSLNPLQKDILDRLVATKTLPVSATPSLRKTIASLKGIIDVKEDILSDMESTAFESDGQLAVRIEPAPDREYQMTILAAPMPNGMARLEPAAGEEYVYDEDAQGRVHMVHRNMTMEADNLEHINNYALQSGMEQTAPNIYNIGEDRALLQLMLFCHEQEACYVMEWPQGHALKFKGVLTINDIHIDVRGDNEWFAVEGDVRVGDRKITLEDLLKACSQTEGDFVKVGENEYVQMTDTLRRHIAELDAVLLMGERKRRQIPKYLVGSLAKTLEKLEYSTDNSYRDFMLKMKQAYERDIEVPADLQATLRPYQKDGYVWMKRLDAWGAGACLADDMGLGKTLQTLAFILSKAYGGPALVVAPKSVIPNWVKETNRFAPSLQVTVLNDADNRQQAVGDAGPRSLVLCTYGVLTTEEHLLASKEWEVACLDEAQQIKNRNTYVSQAAMNLRARSRIALTGTPLQNHVGEIWNLMQFINPGLLGRWNVFRDTYVNATLDETHYEMLQEMIQPFILRRTKQQVLADLPEKTEDVHYVEMTEQELAVYEKMRQTVELKFKKNKTKAERQAAKEIDVSYFDELMKLRLASCDMHLVHSSWGASSTKITSLMEILDTLLAIPENNVLVFSQFTSFLARIKPELKNHGWEYLYLDGQTPMKQRQEMVEQFQRSERRLFLASLKAGGLGINLTAANYVILLDPWWNPAIEQQATDRTHRIGQKRCVSVIRLISSHTIEEKIIRLHEKKQQLSDKVLDGTSESHKLTYEDILDMVSPY